MFYFSTQMQLHYSTAPVDWAVLVRDASRDYLYISLRPLEYPYGITHTKSGILDMALI